MNKVLKMVYNIILIIGISLLLIYFALRLIGVAEIYKVKTGSMEDGIHVGDYILIYKKKDYKLKEIVTYKKDNYYVTHRIVKKNGNKFVTKGDANNIEDEEIELKSIVGKVIYSGGLLNILVNYKYAIGSGLLGLYLLSCYFTKGETKE